MSKNCAPCAARTAAKAAKQHASPPSKQRTFKRSSSRK